MKFTVSLVYEMEEVIKQENYPYKETKETTRFPCSITLMADDAADAIDEAIKMVEYHYQDYTLVRISASKENQE